MPHSDFDSDFNGDGNDDLLWRHSDGTVGIWLGLDNGGFQPLASSLVDVSDEWEVAGLGDFNDDGRADILWRHESGVIGLWLRSETGFDTNAAPLHDVPADWQVAGVGDFDGDGNADILWRHVNGTIGNWLGTDSGGFTINEASVVHVPWTWQIAEVGDFDGDGKSDILWAGQGGQVGTWLGTADGTLVYNDYAGIAGLFGLIEGVGDFNGDGRDDILTRSGNEIYFTPGLIGGYFDFHMSIGFARSTTSGYATSSVGDFNGDGADDIAWRDPAGNLRIGSGNIGDSVNLPSRDLFVDPDWTIQPLGIEPGYGGYY
jgi:hypothetical protein